MKFLYLVVSIFVYFAIVGAVNHRECNRHWNNARCCILRNSDWLKSSDICQMKWEGCPNVKGPKSKIYKGWFTYKFARPNPVDEKDVETVSIRSMVIINWEERCEKVRVWLDKREKEKNEKDRREEEKKLNAENMKRKKEEDKRKELDEKWNSWGQPKH